MATKNNDDVDVLICELEKLNDDPSNEVANMCFAEMHAAQTSVLLEELQNWRNEADKKKQGGGRVIIEGYDEDSMEGAFADALNKASHFFNEHHDISITVLGLVSLPRGGHRATLEVDIVPFTFRLAAHPLTLEAELKRNHANEFAKFKKDEEKHIKDIVHNHFLETAGTAPHVPDYFLINFTDAELLNNMIEKQFFKASHELADCLDLKPVTPAPVPRQAMVRVLRPKNSEE